MEIGYKVLRRNRSFDRDDRVGFSSCVVPVKAGGVAYGYFWTKPKPNCGPLAVFDSHENAFKFWHYQGSISRNVGPKFSIERCVFIREHKDDHLRLPGNRWSGGDLPTGTVLARAVHLI